MRIIWQGLGAAVGRGIFGAGSGFLVGWRNAEEVQLLFFMGFLLVLGEFSFLWGDWALGYDSMEFRHFCYIP